MKFNLAFVPGRMALGYLGFWGIGGLSLKSCGFVSLLPIFRAAGFRDSPH